MICLIVFKKTVQKLITITISSSFSSTFTPFFHLLDSLIDVYTLAADTWRIESYHYQYASLSKAAAKGLL